jgi:methylated-DNA-[protein]-cysteine S-methyltransferase
MSGLWSGSGISRMRVPGRLTGMNRYWTIYESPLGPLTLTGSADGLARLDFPDRGGPWSAEARDPGPFREAIGQLEEYFAGERRAFAVPLDLPGTAFQRTVWDQLTAIPYGATRAYGELARLIGRPDRARAVGAAVGRTPVPIIVPCHRAVGATGSLTGYRGGLERKRCLLRLEGAAVVGSQLSLVP